MPLWIIVGALVLFAVLGDGNPLEGVVTAIAEVTRGPRLTDAHYDKTTGVVPGDPSDLADQAGLSQEAYSLARALSSEEGSSDTTTQAAVCWCIINEAHRRGTSITALVTQAKNPDHSGSYGTQSDIDAQPDADGNPTNPRYKKSDRYCSTALDPYTRDGDIASQCLDGTIADLTGGANQFDRPAGEKNPDQVAANRQRSGSVAVDVAGTDPGIRFWRVG